MRSALQSSVLKTRFIINPHSGRVQRHLPAVLDFARRHGCAWVFTARPGHATELARVALAENCRRVVVVGGDGTLNEVGRALVGTPATLALIPCGSGNGLGRHVGVHGPITRALALLETGHTRTIDTGTADQHPFFNVAGLGLEAELAHRFHTARIRGLLGYLLQGIAALRVNRAESLRILCAGQETHFRAATLAVANGDLYGNNARIAPGAQCDDGLLELSALPPLRGFNTLGLARRLFNGSLAADPRVLRLQATEFEVQRERAGWIHTDGETHRAGTRVRFRIIPSSLHILCPPAAR